MSLSARQEFRHPPFGPRVNAPLAEPLSNGQTSVTFYVDDRAQDRYTPDSGFLFIDDDQRVLIREEGVCGPRDISDTAKVLQACAACASEIVAQTPWLTRETQLVDSIERLLKRRKTSSEYRQSVGNARAAVKVLEAFFDALKSDNAEQREEELVLENRQLPSQQSVSEIVENSAEYLARFNLRRMTESDIQAGQEFFRGCLREVDGGLVIYYFEDMCIVAGDNVFRDKDGIKEVLVRNFDITGPDFWIPQEVLLQEAVKTACDTLDPAFAVYLVKE